MIDRLVVLCRSLPARTKSSGELRFAQILDHLCTRAREVRVFTEMEMNRELFPGLPIYDMSRLEENSRGADLAFLEFWYMDLYVPILRRHGVPVIVDSVDIEFLRRDREKRLLGLPPECYLVEKEREVAVYREADQVWAVSAEDAAQIAGLNPRVTVVPNIFDRVDGGVPFAERHGVCFVGSYSHQPNVDGIRWYRDAVWPRVRHIPHTIVGHDAPDDIRALPGFIGGVARSVDYVRRARVSIAPLRYGAGLKGKVLEAMACGTPVVTTAIGDEGYAAAAGGAAIVADDPEAFAAAVERLHTEQGFWATLSRNGRALAARYAPNVVGPGIDAALAEVLTRRGARRSGAGATTRPMPGRLPLARSARVIDGKVSIVVLNWNARPFLARCLDSIVRHTRQPYELIVVDNGSDDGSPEVVERMVDAHPGIDIRFLRNAENRYFSQGYNQGFAASAADAEYVMVFCNDVEAKEDGWLGDFLAAIRAPNVIAVGSGAVAQLSDEQREIFRRNKPRYPTPGLTRRMRRSIDDPTFAYTHIYGYCFLLRKSPLARTGLYLEGGDFRQYHSDWEWYVRFKVLGHDIGLITPRVHHWHSVSELIAFHPHRYQDLVEKLAHPQLVDRYLKQGRPLYEEESGYRELQRRAREAGGATRGR